MTHSRFFRPTLILAISLAACDLPGPSAPEAEASDELVNVLASASADPRSDSQGSSLFDRLAAEIPGFAGLYRADVCAVAVVLTDLSDQEKAVRLVKEALEQIVGRACATGIRVHAVQGKFTYIELQRWLAASDPLLRIRGVGSVHVDYQKNRLIVTIAARSVATDVLAALPQLGIPADAVEFAVGGSNPTRGVTTAQPTRK